MYKVTFRVSGPTDEVLKQVKKTGRHNISRLHAIHIIDGFRDFQGFQGCDELNSSTDGFHGYLKSGPIAAST
jgi:hypothetical protein|tara:strand:- start:30 stop:245 length:216 start_codon:yes stop_codon:yes gene_type:complete